MTTTQLNQLKNAGFTLEQIITIGEIFNGKPESAPKRSTRDITEEMRQAYERGRREAEERQRQKDMWPIIRDWPPIGNQDEWRYKPGPTCLGGTSFSKRCRDFIKAQQNSLFLGSMEIPRWISQTVSSEPSP